MSSPADLRSDSIFDAPSAYPTRPKIAAAPEERGAVLQYKADRGRVAYVAAIFALRGLVWAYASPLFAALAVIPLVVASVFIAPVNHHHQHLNTFRYPLLNRLYDLLLALQTGVAPYSWVLHHNLGHHRNYLNQRPHESADESAWTRPNGTQMSRVEYTVDMLWRHQIEIMRVGKRHPRFLRYWLAMKLPLYGVIGVALWIDPVNTTLVFLLPGFIALAHTIWATYEHHAGCPTEDHWGGSVNRDNRAYNWMTANLGLHTAHHTRPGVHWSLLPKVHEEIKDRIPEQLILKSFW